MRSTFRDDAELRRLSYCTVKYDADTLTVKIRVDMKYEPVMCIGMRAVTPVLLVYYYRRGQNARKYRKNPQTRTLLV